MVFQLYNFYSGFLVLLLFNCFQDNRPTSGGKQKNDDVSSFSQSGIIVGVSVSAALLLFILTAVLFICRRRRSR